MQHFLDRKILSNPVWAYVGVAGLFALVNTNNQPVPQWGTYLYSLAVLLACLLPQILLIVFQPIIEKRWEKKWFWATWWLTWIIWIIVLFSFAQDTLQLDVFAIVCLCVEISLRISVYVGKLPKNRWLKALGFDGAIVIMLLMLSGMLALMATSSLGNPDYDLPDQLLIGGVFDAHKIASNFLFLLSFWLQLFTMYMAAFLFYALNRRLLIPYFLQKKGVLVYALGVMTIAVLAYPWVAQFLIWLPINKLMGGIFHPVPFEYENGWGAAGIMVGSLPVVLAIQWFEQGRRIAQLEQQKSRAELDMLKQQMNPHFFFNTLNNLYGLSLANSPQTPEVVLKLSEFMRYVIYKGKNELVDVEGELKHIEDYVTLQSIRLRHPLDFKFTKNISTDSPQLPPMMMMVLVENAFKHGVEPATGKAFLHLSIEANLRSIIFTCINSCEEPPVTPKGIGLENLARRLELLYPSRHTLVCEPRNASFFAQLTLLAP